MLVDINPNMELPEYRLTLCKLNGEPLQELSNIEDLEIKIYFANIDEITFSVPMYIIEPDGTKVLNEIYKIIDGSMLVLLNDMQYFILTKPEIIADSSSGEKYKQFLGYSREYELAQKRLSGYEGAVRKIYTEGYEGIENLPEGWGLNENNVLCDENGLEVGFLNYVERVTSWRVGYVSTEIREKARSLSFSKGTLLSAMQEVQQTFGCLFQYDTVNKIINVYEVTQLGTNQGLYISDKNFIEKITQSINHDEIKTRLYVYGKDNISIQSVNITGQPYIENYDFFMKPEYMSQTLIDNLNEHKAIVQSNNGVYENLLADLDELTEIMGNKKIELANLITQLSVLEQDLDVAISSLDLTLTQDEQNAIKADIQNLSNNLIPIKTNEINAKQIEIADVQTQIDAIKTSIYNLGKQVSFTTFLKNKYNDDNVVRGLLDELDTFIREDEFVDNNFTEDNIQELYREGMKVLNRISQPNIQFNVDVVDFLSLVEAQHIWDKFIVGDLVQLEHEELGISYTVRLVKYEYKRDDNSLNLSFSNTNSVDDANIYLRDLLETLTTTAGTVVQNMPKWNKAEEANFIINEYINSNLNLAKQQILKAEGQKPILDERGIWIIKENPDGTVDPKQMRLINNVLAISNDNWNTVSTAISGDGINAEVIYGKLGRFAQVESNQIIVGDGSQTLDDVLADGLDSDKYVEKNTLYNMTMISPEGGIQVFDRSGKERVQIGNYTIGKYGIEIKDKSGSTTVLDEDGILQTWQESNVDNVDANNALKLYVYIPYHTSVINKATLRFKREKFRAYSKSIASGGQSSTTSGGGGGAYSVSTNDEVTAGVIGNATDVNQQWVSTQTAGDPAHSHLFMKTLDHKHAISISPHSHTFSLPEHYHWIYIPSHTHEITYGIYESTLPQNIKVLINGLDYTSYLGATNGVFNTDQEELDITPFLEIGQWNEIALQSSTLGRLDATIFIQAFINTVRKSIISDEHFVASQLFRILGIQSDSYAIAHRPNEYQGIEKLYQIYMSGNTATLSYTKWMSSDDKTYNVWTKNNIKNATVVLDGEWKYNTTDAKWKFVTFDRPMIIYTDLFNSLYAVWYDDPNSRVLLATDVKNFKALRTWKNANIPSMDYGIVVSYIKNNNRPYYRNYCIQSNGIADWEVEREYTEFTGEAISLNMFNTNDFRFGVMIESNDGQTTALYSSRNWFGMGNQPDKFMTTAYSEIGLFDINNIMGLLNERFIAESDIDINLIDINNITCITSERFIANISNVNIDFAPIMPDDFKYPLTGRIVASEKLYEEIEFVNLSTEESKLEIENNRFINISNYPIAGNVVTSEELYQETGLTDIAKETNNLNLLSKNIYDEFDYPVINNKLLTLNPDNIIKETSLLEIEDKPNNIYPLYPLCGELLAGKYPA